MRMTVAKEFRGEAAHRLTSPEAGVCAAVHGHSYRVRVEISGPVNPETGMVVNFKDLDAVGSYLGEVIDHRLLLNQDDPILEDLMRMEKQVPGAFKITTMPGPFEPTAENLAQIIFNFVDRWTTVERSPFQVESITVWETSKCSATVAR